MPSLKDIAQKHLKRLAAYPACFHSRADFERWADSASTGDHCKDCRPEYKAKMERQGRCNYADKVYFIEVKNSYGETEIVKRSS